MGNPENDERVGVELLSDVDLSESEDPRSNVEILKEIEACDEQPEVNTKEQQESDMWRARKKGTSLDFD